MYSDAELSAFGFTPFHLGEPCDAVIVQTDHVEYRELSADDVPGVVAVLDGRRVTEIEQWPEIAYRRIGAPNPRC